MLYDAHESKATVIAICAAVGVVVGGLPDCARAQEAVYAGPGLEPLTDSMIEVLGGGDIRFAATIDSAGNLRMLSKHMPEDLTVQEHIRATIAIQGESSLNHESPNYVLLFKNEAGDPALSAARWSGNRMCLVADDAEPMK